MDKVDVNGSIGGSFILGSTNGIGYTAEQVAILIAQITTIFAPKPYQGVLLIKG